MLKFALALAVLSAPVSGEYWRYQERVDPLNDSTGGALQVIANDGKSRLTFTCDLSRPNRPMMMQLTADKYLGSSIGRVMIRVGKREPLSMVWDFNRRVASNFTEREVKVLAKEVAGAEDVFIRAYDFDGNPVDMRFWNMPPKELFSRVLVSCGKDNFLS